MPHRVTRYACSGCLQRRRKSATLAHIIIRIHDRKRLTLSERQTSLFKAKNSLEGSTLMTICCLQILRSLGDPRRFALLTSRGFGFGMSPAPKHQDRRWGASILEPFPDQNGDPSLFQYHILPLLLTHGSYGGGGERNGWTMTIEQTARQQQNAAVRQRGTFPLLVP